MRHGISGFDRSNTSFPVDQIGVFGSPNFHLESIGNLLSQLDRSKSVVTMGWPHISVKEVTMARPYGSMPTPRKLRRSLIRAYCTSTYRSQRRRRRSSKRSRSKKAKAYEHPGKQSSACRRGDRSVASSFMLLGGAATPVMGPWRRI
jgi:hypothetical protein